MNECLKKYLVEFIGTFFLVFTIGATAAWGGETCIAPIAIGFVLMVMVYAGGYISGGHYNPAVSLACAIRGALEWKQWIPYAVAQILGGSCAALAINLLSGGLDAPAKVSFNIATIIIAEFLFTFALCYVVLHTATASKTAGNSYYGFAIGSTVTVGAFAVGSVCMAAFNPAVAISATIMGCVCCPCIALVTIGANLLGGACAGLVYKIANNDD